MVRKDLGQHILAAKQFARECVGEGDVLNLKKILAYYKLNGDVNTRFLLSALPYRVLNQVFFFSSFSSSFFFPFFLSLTHFSFLFSLFSFLSFLGQKISGVGPSINKRC